jgi:predicted DNA-binding transcriptional regulator AlpA
VRRLTTRIDVMPMLPVVFGLGEIEAAAAIGISASKFRALVNDKRMPSPRRLDGRNIWDVDELREAFKALPHAKEDERADSWTDVVQSG